LVKKFLNEFYQKLNAKSTASETASNSTNSQTDSNSNINNSTQLRLRDTTNIINNRKRKTTNFMDSLCDKVTVSQQNQLISEIDIEINAYVSHSFPVIVADKKELKRHRSLLFFKLFHEQFPKLTRIVRIIHSVPATSVPSESLFSRAGLIQNYLRNRLEPSLLEKLTFIKQNL